jgi:predicted phosphohydrolase
MLIQYASDLHLEMPGNEKFLLTLPIIPRADILVLAGDIVPFARKDEFAWFFDWLSSGFRETYWIPGNHEYYDFDLSKKQGPFIENIRNNVFLVNDYVITIEQVSLIFATMWTNIRPKRQITIAKRMNDFHLIRYRGNRLTAEDLNQLHEASLSFIKNELATDINLKKVVVTHHVPTFINYPKEYFGDLLTEAFGVNLTQLIRDSGPDYWLTATTTVMSRIFRSGKHGLPQTSLVMSRTAKIAVLAGLKFLTSD